MAVSNIPDDHHVVRFAKKRQTIRENGVVVGVYPELFVLRPPNPPIRPNPEKYFSCNYYEHFAGSPQKRMQSCCAALTFAPKPQDALARLHVGRIKDVFKSLKSVARVTHEPSKHSPSYAAIRPQAMTAKLSAMLASTTVVELVEIANV